MQYPEPEDDACFNLEIASPYRPHGSVCKTWPPFDRTLYYPVRALH